MITKNYILMSIITVFLMGFTGCQTQDQNRGSEIKKAVAVLHSISESQAKGVVTFTRVPSGVKIVADVEGLSPGNHGVYIYEYGDCNALNTKSAGGYFDPGKMPRGRPESKKLHTRDLKKIVANAKGKAHFEYTDGMLRFRGPHSIIGRAVVIHAGENDLTYQPTGNAGPRVACGVIGIAKTAKE
ncbi:MAG: superoxide dismutase family protein [bacterium]